MSDSDKEPKNAWVVLLLNIVVSACTILLKFFGG